MPVAMVDGIELDPACWGDRGWRLNNLYYITDTSGRKIKFVPNDTQNQLLSDLWYLNIILKSRQRGFSTFVDIMGLDLAVWMPNQTVGIIAHGLFEAQNIFSTKVKFPYDNLPAAVRETNPTVLDNRQELKLRNGSWVYVSTSMRSATVQYLHVSEFGKISRRTPEKAKEIVNGSFNAVHQGNMIFVESTAEGRDGYFYNMCEEAQKKEAIAARLTPLDFRFHFYPWYTDTNNVLAPEDAESVAIGAKSVKYFEGLEKQLNIKVTQEQRAWYVIKESQLREGRDGGKSSGAGMKAEFPSTAKEAFEAAVHGAIYGEEMSRARNEGRITKVPYMRSAPVYTFWDLGLSKRSGTTALWCMQNVGMQHRFLKCFEDHGKALDHYVRWLLDTGYSFGGHYLPHDAGVRRLGTVKVDSWREMLEGLIPAHTFKLVPVISAISIGIDQTKAKFDSCVFDAEGCEDGIRALENYQYEWDPDREAYHATPLHDWCFTGDTGVLTPGGICQMQALPPAGTVLTPDGWKPYTNPRITRQDAPLVAVAFYDGLILRCTPDHLFMTMNGWLPAGSLPQGVIIQSTGTVPLVIKSVSPIRETADVWCVTVPDGASFSLSNGAVVHNCSNYADAMRQFGQANMMQDRNPMPAVKMPMPMDRGLGF